MATTHNLYTGDGSTVLFSFTFPYLEDADVKVSLDGVNTISYSLANATTVEFNTAPGVGEVIRIYRDTGAEVPAATFYKGSSIRAGDLNDNFDQTLYIAQELQNNAILSGGSNPLLSDLDLGGYKITGLALPTADTDAANRGYVSSIVASGIGDGDKGDIVVSGSGSVFSIGAGVINDADVNASAGIVASKLSFTQAGTGAAARTVDSKLKDVVSVKDFGAVGDGVADDTVAIQAAFDNVGPSAVVYLPAGNFKLTAPVVITAPLRLTGAGKGLSRFTYTGDGNTAAIKVEATDVVIENLSIHVFLNTGASGSVICITIGGSDVSGLRLTNLCLRGQEVGGLTTSHGITCSNLVQADHCFIDNVDFEGHNFAFFTSNTFGATGNSARYWTVRNCTIENCKRGLSFNSDLATSGRTDAWQNVLVESCLFLGSSSDADRCTSVGGDSCLNLTVTNCVFRDRIGTDGCIHIENHMDNSVITGNTIYNCGGGIVLFPLTSRFVVSNNNITLDPSVAGTPSADLPSSQLDYSGVTVVTNPDGQANDCSIIGNIIYGAECGISVSGNSTGTSSSVSNNRIIRCISGLNLVGNTINCIIDRNTFVECHNGIQAQGSSSNVIQFGGSKAYIQNCTRPVFVVGAGTTAPLLLDSPVVSSSFNHTGASTETFTIIKKPIQADGTAYITVKSESEWASVTSQFKVDTTGPAFSAARNTFSKDGSLTVADPVFDTTTNYLRLRCFSSTARGVEYTIAFSGHMMFSTYPVP